MSSLIEAKNLSKVYKSGKQSIVALDNLNLTIPHKEYIAIVGPSGAGKSTLVHILGGLESPTKGTVTFGGKDIYKMSDNQISQWRAKLVGFVFQFYHLIEELTVQENIMLPSLLLSQDRKTTFKKVEELLKYLKIEEKRYAFPSELSGGQKQRVAIARALINDPQIIFCDEPTGNLDSESAQRVMSLLSSLNQEKGKTVVIVTHNQDVAENAKVVLCMKGGRLLG
jgi:putative ABC transport system ATP-binding protein